MTTVVVCNTIHNIISYKIKLGGGEGGESIEPSRWGHTLKH